MGPYTCPLTNTNITKNHPMVKGATRLRRPSQKGEETNTGPATETNWEESAGGYPEKGIRMEFKGWMHWGNDWNDEVYLDLIWYEFI